MKFLGSEPLISDSGASYTPGVSERRNGVSTFLNSGLKDVAKQTDAAGSVTATRKYDAYGMVIGSTGTWKGPFGYSGSAGYQEDETGLQLLGHRYYDPSTGRFLTRDPIKDGRNWYGYCGNKPVVRVDANGLEWSIVVYGDNEGVPLGSVGYYFDRPIVHRYRGDKEWTGPSKKDLIEAMIECEGDFYFYGHGNGDGSISINSKGEKLTQADLRYIAREKKRRGKKKMKSATLRACFQAEEGEWVNNWLGIAESVTGVCGLTGRLWPPRLAEPKTFRNPLPVGPTRGPTIDSPKKYAKGKG
ncbi:MAG: RHS repeat-associated core domain-containing protein [Fimbriimonadales bacterium]|nr:RHS repeat-associated core domain-containing protein [Fimbriimonadales bacterium]